MFKVAYFYKTSNVPTFNFNSFFKLQQKDITSNFNRAFTLLELVIAMVILGVIISLSMPSFSKNELMLATQQLAEHIRYTQHLALGDDKFNPNDEKWYRSRWQLVIGKSNFTDNEIAYTIFADKSANKTGQADISEMAYDPQDSSKFLSGGYSGTLRVSDKRANKLLNLGLSYNIEKIELSEGCGKNTTRVSFDEMGRVYSGNISGDSMFNPYQSRVGNGPGIVTSPCAITLTHKNGEYMKLLIHPQSGYVQMDYTVYKI